MQADGAATVLLQRLQVAQRLRVLQRAETVWLAGDGYILRVLRRDLDEQAGVGPALVQLPGRMQETRPEAQRRRDVQAVAQREASPLKLTLNRFVVGQIGHDRHVVARLHLLEERGDISVYRAARSVMAVRPGAATLAVSARGH